MLRKNNGFTLISSLIALALTSLLILLIIFITRVIYKGDHYDLQHHQSVYVFLNQLSSEIRSSKVKGCSSDSLTLQNTNGNITYRLSGQRLIREVDDTGYDIALENVNAVDFQCVEKEVNMTVDLGWGHPVNWSEIQYTGGQDVP